ncbi:MAG: hypothetical protein LBT29_05355, partial [Flavobacteriaceae bacterium]|nr:hypothetical protein [Flavobacteriaceae bacterium]
FEILPYKWSLSKIDAYVMINQKLIDYFCSIRQKPSLMLSAIVDIERFKEQPQVIAPINKINCLFTTSKLAYNIFKC